MNDYILKANKINKSFNRQILNNISFNLKRGTTLGVVGESGSGKTTLGRIIVKLYEPDSGDIYFNNKNIKKISNKDLSRDVQMVFQSTFSAVNPAFRIEDILIENLNLYNIGTGKEARLEKIKEVLHMVALNDSYLKRYPHQLSGGELQRIGIARALLLEPSVIILDEITSALDVNIQSEILNILVNIQKKFGTSYLFISHDLSVIYHMCDDIMVIKNGNVVEYDTSYNIFNNPQHEYTKKLIENCFK